MTRLTLTLRATGCYLLGLTISCPIGIALIGLMMRVRWDMEGAASIWMFGLVFSLPLFLILATLMAVFYRQLLTNLERWCLLIPVVTLPAALVQYELFVFVTNSGRTSTLGITVPLWGYCSALIFPCAAIASALFYASYRLWPVTALNRS